MFKFIRPEFFDIFGAGAFAVIAYMSMRALFLGASFPLWFVIFLVIAGVLGLVIDGTIVARTYFKKKF